MTRSIHARLTLWYTLVLTVPLAAFAIASYVVFSRALHERTDAFVSDALSVFAREVLAERRATPDLGAAIQRTLEEVRFRDLDILVRDETGRLIARSRTDSAMRAPFGVIESRATVGERTLAISAMYPLHEIEAVLSRLRRMFWIAIPLLIASAATGGWFLAKRNLAPVERSIEQQQRFMADASHELRTPAAVLRAEADVTLSRASRSEAEYRSSMSVVQDAARRLTRIVDDIFLLARADAGHLVLRAEEVELADIVVDAVRAAQAIGAMRDVTIDLTHAVEARVRADADLLGRVLLNLLDNAVKYSSPGSTVHVRMASAAGSVTVTVVDRGSGIPPASQERVFERFYRVDTARSRAENSATSGAGLGLPIARRIAELHGGRLDLVASRAGHTEFALRLPALAGGGA